MGFNVRDGGVFKPLQNAKARVGGAWVQIKAVAVRNNGGWHIVWQHLITATVAASVNNLDVSTLFAAEVWAATTPKEVVVAEGVTVGSTAPANPAMTVPGTWDGALTIRNFGNIDGAGGAANGGAGGAAINSLKAGIVVANESGGNIRGGGGGGGKGGVGGNGTYTVVVREPTSGNADVSRNYWTDQVSLRGAWVWNGATILSNNNEWSVTVGAYTYYATTLSHTVKQWVRTGSQGDGYDATLRVYFIYRTSNTNQSSTGGAGGNGGRGLGSNHNSASGANGAAAGGTNAGAGGKGGNGGGWGAGGATGATGANGTVTNGSAGVAGGAAGAAITGAARTVVNNGTILGAH